MKVLHVINSLNTGGAEKLVLDTVPLYNEKSIKTDVLIFDGEKYPFYNKLEQKKCCRIFSLNTKQLYSPLLIFKIIPYLKKYDVVHVHLFPAQYWVVFAKLLSFSGVKLVFTEHSTSNRRLRSKWFSILDKYIYKGYDIIICISQEMEGIIRKHTAIEKNAFRVINNGIDLNSILTSNGIEVRKKLKSIKANDKLVLQVAGFRKEKDQRTLIRAMKLLPKNIKLLLVGDGETRQDCENLVEQLGLKARVLFLGVRSDVPNLLKSADVIVLSSNYEGLSLSSIEGMAAGKPFIASSVPGLIEVVKGAGLLFEQGNEKELAQYILSLLNDVEYYNQIASQCFEKAQKYDIHKMVNKHIDLYKSLVYEV